MVLSTWWAPWDSSVPPEPELLCPGPAAAEWKLCPPRSLWMRPPAAPRLWTSPRRRHPPPGGDGEHGLQYLVGWWFSREEQRVKACDGETLLSSSLCQEGALQCDVSACAGETEACPDRVHWVRLGPPAPGTLFTYSCNKLTSLLDGPHQITPPPNLIPP